MDNRYVIIMAGGVGSRFWPLSRRERPKQFLDIVGSGETLIQQTYRRFKKTCPEKNIFVVTNSDHRDMVIEQLGIDSSRVLVEPFRRNTAPCLAYGTFRILKENPDAIITVTPADHLIVKEDKFNEVIQSCISFAGANDALVTLGIKPDRPETGYGYIQADQKKPVKGFQNLLKVKTFTEKPDLDLAKVFLESGDFLWNAGIFIWSLKSISKAFDRYLPEVDDLFKEGAGKYSTPLEAEFIKQTYAVCRNISIDYGVMEKADNVYVMSVDFGWSDLGTWGSLYETRPKDSHNNSVIGNNVLAYESTGCVVNMPKDKLVVLQGLTDYIVVEEDNALLICRKQDEQQIRQFVNDIKVEKGEKYI